MLFKLLVLTLVFGIGPLLLGYASWAVRRVRSPWPGPLPQRIACRMMRLIEAVLACAIALGWVLIFVLRPPRWMPATVGLFSLSLFFFGINHLAAHRSIEWIQGRRASRRIGRFSLAGDPLWDPDLDR